MSGEVHRLQPWVIPGPGCSRHRSLTRLSPLDAWHEGGIRSAAGRVALGGPGTAQTTVDASLSADW